MTSSIDRLASADLTPELATEIRSLLNLAFDDGFSDDDWQHAIGGWHVVVLDGGRLLAHAAAVPRALYVAGRPFHVGYVEGVATHPTRRGLGHGSDVMHEISSLLHEHFQMGALSTGRHDFYRRLGWESWQGPTYVRRAADLVRTEDEDDGVMVLRFGPSTGLDLAAPISCDERTGDDW